MNMNEIELRRLERLMNPPLLMRDRCRFCGKPLKVTDELTPRRKGQFPEMYAHWACYKREGT